MALSGWRFLSQGILPETAENSAIASKIEQKHIFLNADGGKEPADQ